VILLCYGRKILLLFAEINPAFTAVYLSNAFFAREDITGASICIPIHTFKEVKRDAQINKKFS
jgi:hypothetical protein